MSSLLYTDVVHQDRHEAKKRREKEVQSADEVLTEKPRGKRAQRGRHSSEDEPVYANQAQIVAELRRQQEQRAMLDEQERLERERLEREAERERLDEAEAKRLRQVESRGHFKCSSENLKKYILKMIFPTNKSLPSFYIILQRIQILVVGWLIEVIIVTAKI